MADEIDNPDNLPGPRESHEVADPLELVVIALQDMARDMVETPELRLMLQDSAEHSQRIILDTLSKAAHTIFDVSPYPSPIPELYEVASRVAAENGFVLIAEDDPWRLDTSYRHLQMYPLREAIEDSPFVVSVILYDVLEEGLKIAERKRILDTVIVDLVKRQRITRTHDLWIYINEMNNLYGLELSFERNNDVADSLVEAMARNPALEGQFKHRISIGEAFGEPGYDSVIAYFPVNQLEHKDFTTLKDLTEYLKEHHPSV